MNHVNLDAYDEAVKRFILSLPTDAGGAVLELAGTPIAHVLPVSLTNGAADEWDATKDTRRCELIDREIAGTLSVAEAAELRTLQATMLRYRRQVAPLPLDDTRKLHRELLAKSVAGPTS